MNRVRKSNHIEHYSKVRMTSVLFFPVIMGVAIVIAIIITYVATKKKFSLNVHELEVRNEALEIRHREALLQLSELMKIKEEADERLFNLDKYLAVAISEKELTYDQIAKLEQQIEKDSHVKEQLQLNIQEAGKLQIKAETELSEARKVIEEYQNKLTPFHRNPQ
jgi:hypothetical protein